MSEDELTAKYKKLTEEGGPLHGKFSVHGVQACNYKVDGLAGRPFCIGHKHVAYASDHCGGILGTDVCEKIPCEMEIFDGRKKKCHRPLSSHTHDTVLFLILERNLANKEASEALFAIKEQMIADKIDGVAFIENGFRIAKPTEIPTPPTPE